MANKNSPIVKLSEAEQKHEETKEQTEALAADLAGASFTMQVDYSDGCLYLYREEG